MPLASAEPRPQINSVVFTGGEEGRNRIHVRGERNDWIPPMGKDVEAIGIDGAALDVTGKARGQSRKGLEEIVARGSLVVGNRLDIHEPARKMENVGHGARYLRRRSACRQAPAQKADPSGQEVALGMTANNPIANWLITLIPKHRPGRDCSGKNA